VRARETQPGGRYLARERGANEPVEEVEELPPVPMRFPIIDRIEPVQLRALLAWCAERGLIRAEIQ